MQNARVFYDRYKGDLIQKNKTLPVNSAQFSDIMYNVKIKHKNAYQTMCVFYLPRRKYDEKELRELINSRQKNELYGDLKRIYDTTEDTRLKDECAKKINAMAYGHRVDRLEAVKTKIYAEMKKAQEVEQRTHTALHTNTVQKAYRESIASLTKGLDITGSFSQLPRNAIKEMLSKPWLGSNYSSRIWNNNDQFIRKVQTVVENGVTNGHSVSRMADKLTSFIAEPCQGQRYIAERLVRTETAHIHQEADFKAYEDLEIKKYKYLATLDYATCELCQPLDGRTFNVSDRAEGVNAPVMHPRCRCTTTFDMNYVQRRARDPLTGRNSIIDGNITYSQWKASLTAEQKAALELARKKDSRKAADKLQHVQYQKVLGRKVVPQSFDKFQELKYNNKERWEFIKLDYRRQNKLIQDPSLTLPNAKTATADDRKFTNYLFGGTNKEGLAKGKAFESRFGYNINNYKELKSEILKKADKYPVKVKNSDVHGVGYEQKIVLYGYKNKPANVVIGWKEKEGKTWLTSAYIKEVGRK